jgi:hypothetical protein
MNEAWLRRRATLCLIVAVLGCVGLLSGCGGSGYRPSPSAQGDSATETALFRLYGTITGNAQERQAGQFMGYWNHNVAIAKCLHDSERSYPWPLFTDDWHGWAPRGGTSGTRWLAPLGYDWALADARRMAAASTFSPMPVGGVADVAHTVAATAQCASSVPAEVDYPEGTEYHQLHTAYYAMITSVDGRLASYRREYRACMSQAGYPVTGYPALMSKIETRLATSAPSGAGFASAGHSADSYGRPALAADATCRQPAHDAGMTLLAPMITAYERRFSAQLVDLHGLWEDGIDRANSKSQSPGFGSPQPRPDD